jgi:hypothetical protein
MGRLFLLTFFVAAFLGCQTKYPGVPREYQTLLDSAFDRASENAAELQQALVQTPSAQKEGMAFLISYMPESDLKTLKADFLLENVDYAYKARAKYAWCAALPDSIFLNEVLPYANISEERDNWRKDFYERFAKYVDDKENMVDAVMAVAHNIKNETGVEYNTNRSRVDISPFQAMKEQMATCTGLSILLTDAYRAVGIPSRLAGTAMWTNYKGNHTWSEVWIDGNWHFIEYYPDTLDKSWFVADAGKADPENMLHWIYAASYKPTGMPYYAAPDGSVMEVVDLDKLPEAVKSRFQRMKESSGEREIDRFAYGQNVTPRYIALYEESLKHSKLAENELWANVVVFADSDVTKSGSRLKCRVDVLNDDKMVSFGYSPRKTDDMNRFLQFKLKKETEYQFVVTNPEHNINQSFTINTGNDSTRDVQLILK